MEAKLDNEEVTSMQFTDPKTVLKMYVNGELWLAPPQVWEIAAMANLTKFDDLKTFAINREKLGCESRLPVLKFCSDGMFSLYPGDDLYPSNPDYEGTEEVTEKAEDSVNDAKFETKNQNRMVQIGLHGSTIKVNVKEPFGHLAPIDFRLQDNLGSSNI